MPKAARARVASPPAGTALARAAKECLPGRVLTGRGSILHVTLSVTNVNGTVTSDFVMADLIAVILRCERRSRKPRRMSGPNATAVALRGSPSW